MAVFLFCFVFFQPLRFMAVFLFTSLFVREVLEFSGVNQILRSIFKISFLQLGCPVAVVLVVRLFYLATRQVLANNRDEIFRSQMVVILLAVIYLFSFVPLCSFLDRVLDSNVETDSELYVRFISIVLGLEINSLVCIMSYMLCYFYWHFLHPGLWRIYNRTKFLFLRLCRIIDFRIKSKIVDVNLIVESNSRRVKRLKGSSKPHSDKNNKKTSVLNGDTKPSQLIQQSLANLSHRPKVAVESGSSLPATGVIVGHTSLFLNLSNIKFDDNVNLGKQKSKNKRDSKYEPDKLLKAVQDGLDLIIKSEDFKFYGPTGLPAYSFDTIMSATPLGAFLPQWANRMTFLSFANFLVSLHQHPLSANPNHPYTKLRFQLVSYAVAHWMYSDIDFAGSMALFMALCPCDAQPIAQDSSQYQLPPRYEYQSNRFYNCDKATFGNLENVVFGEPNFWMEIFDHKQVKADRSVVTGVVRSLAIKHANKIQPILAGLRSKFPPVPQVVEFCKGKRVQKRLSYRRESGGVWFTNLLPRKAFYFNHNSGDFATYEVVCNIVKRILVDMENFARNYVEVRVMNESEKADLLRVRKQRFISIMRTPEVQMMFLSGVKRTTITSGIYHDHVKLLTDNNITARDEARERLLTSRDKRISASRMQKYSDMYNLECDFDEEYEDYDEDQFFTESFVRFVPHDDVLNYLIIFLFVVFVFYLVEQIEKFTKRVHVKIDEAQATMSNVSGTIDNVVRNINNVVGTPVNGSASLSQTLTTGNAAATATASVMARVDAILNSWSPTNMFCLDRTSSPETLLLILEFKTILHIIYEWQYGTPTDVLKWASNFPITRSNEIFSMLSMLVNSMPRQTPSGELVQLESFSEVASQFITFLRRMDVDSIDISDINRANAKFAYLKHTQQSAKSTIDLAMTVLRVVCSLLFSYDPFDPTLNEFSALLLSGVTDARKWKVEPPVTKEQHIKFLQDYAKYATANTNENIDKVPSFLRKAFMSAYTSMQDQASVSTPFVVGDRRRAEPVFIAFTGAPGSGKSTCMGRIKQNIYRVENNNVEDDYVYNPDTEYFEGYACNLTVTMDDAFIHNDPAVRVSQLTNIIKMVNSAPHQLNMAFGDKGKLFFNSKYILMSTNAMGPGIQFTAAVSDIGAFERRMHIIVHRDAPLNKDDPLNDTFRVTSCPMFKEVVGQELNADQLTVLMRRCRQVLEERFATMTTPSMVDLDTVRVPGLDINPPVGATNAAAESVDLQAETVSTPLVKVSTSPETFIRLFFTAFEAPQWWKDNWIPALVMLFMTMAGGTLCVKLLWPHLFPAGEEMVTESADHRRRKLNANRNKKVRSKQITPSRFKVESNSRTNNGFDRLRKCTVQFICTYSDNQNQYVSDCTAIHMGDDLYLYPAHFHFDFDKCTIDSFQVITETTNVYVDYLYENIVFFTGMDAQMIKLATSHCRPISARPFLISGPDHQVISELAPGNFISVISRRKEGATVLSGLLAPTGHGVSYVSGSERFRVECPVRYECRTQKGDSGGLVVYADTKGKHWILGMHVGKINATPTKEIGIAIPWCATMLQTALTEFPSESPEAGALQVDSISDETVETTSNVTTFPFKVEYTVLAGQRMPHKSNIRRSMFHGYWGPSVYMPAFLSTFTDQDGNLVNPRLVAISAQAQDKIPIMDYPAESGIDYLFSKYRRNSKFAFVLGWDQVVNGVPAIGFPGLDGTTSAGYPFNLLIGVKGKKPYIEFDGERHVYMPSFLNDMIDYDNKFKEGKGHEVEVIWADMLKDELRPISKAWAGKTRLISTSPLHFTLLIRKYFGSFVAYVHKLATHAFTSVGINPHSNDWKVLFERFYSPSFLDNPYEPFTEEYDQFLKDNSSIISGDFSKWDKRAPIDVARVFIDYVNRWYNDDYSEVRLALWDKMSHQLRIFMDTVYYIHNGNPSGNAITAEYNSFIQMLCWLPILQEDLGLTTDQFDLALYGDDCLVIMKKPGVTTTDLTPFWKERYQLEFTHSSKDDVTVHETIFTVTYIGRKFVRYQNPRYPVSSPVILAPLDMVVIREIMYYVRGNESVEKQNMVQSFSSVMTELSHYPPEDYHREAKIILDYADIYAPADLAEALHVVYDSMTYDDYYRRKYIQDGLPMYSLIHQVR